MFFFFSAKNLGLYRRNKSRTINFTVVSLYRTERTGGSSVFGLHGRLRPSSLLIIVRGAAAATTTSTTPLPGYRFGGYVSSWGPLFFHSIIYRYLPDVVIIIIIVVVIIIIVIIVTIKVYLNVGPRLIGREFFLELHTNRIAKIDPSPRPSSSFRDFVVLQTQTGQQKERKKRIIYTNFVWPKYYVAP